MSFVSTQHPRPCLTVVTISSHPLCLFIGSLSSLLNAPCSARISRNPLRGSVFWICGRLCTDTVGMSPCMLLGTRITLQYAARPLVLTPPPAGGESRESAAMRRHDRARGFPMDVICAGDRHRVSSKSLSRTSSWADCGTATRGCDAMRSEPWPYSNPVRMRWPSHRQWYAAYATQTHSHHSFTAKTSHKKRGEIAQGRCDGGRGKKTRRQRSPNNRRALLQSAHMQVAAGTTSSIVDSWLAGFPLSKGGVDG